MNIQVGKKALLTTHNWFIAPDGLYYKAVFGTIKSVKTDDEVLGIKTNRNSTNWYVEIGDMTIAGCQIFYAVRTDKCNFGPVASQTFENGALHKYTDRSNIYNADYSGF